MRVKPIVGAAALAMMTLSAAAQGRPDARAMSCGQVHALIDQYGAVVLTTGQYTYDRYVASRRFCLPAERPELASVPTRDTPNCPVYRCDHFDPEDDFW